VGDIGVANSDPVQPLDDNPKDATPTHGGTLSQPLTRTELEFPGR
jgi:hypothetical protein